MKAIFDTLGADLTNLVEQELKKAETEYNTAVENEKNKNEEVAE